MQTELQSILAIVVVVVAVLTVIYFTFLKKKTGCGGDCGCSKYDKNK